MIEEEDLRTEEEIDADIAEKQAGKKKRGRPKNENYLPWSEAREFMRSELIPSRGKFFEWWDSNKPKAIPRFPYRVYQEEWVSWNDFLGTNNKFNEKVGTKWRALLDASTWAHTLKLETQVQWMEFAKTDQLPADIPARPDLVYENWRSWGHWLGNRPVEAIEVKQEAIRSQVYFIVRDLEDPQNVLTYGIETSISSMKERWQREKFDIVKLFWYQPEKAAEMNKIVAALSSPYQGFDRQRITPNVWEIVWHASMLMEPITKQSLQ